MARSGGEGSLPEKLLGAFVNEVIGLTNGGVLTVEQSRGLIDTARAAIAMMEA